MGSNCVFVLAGNCVELVQAVVHAAVLDTKDDAAGGIRPALGAVVNPVAQALGNLQGSFISGILVNINNTCHNLVHSVPRHPGFGGDVGLVLFYVVKLEFNVALVGNSSAKEKSGADGILAFF